MATSNDNLLKQLIETENSHDVEKVLTFLTDDIVFEDVTFGVVMEGKDAFKQVYPTFITAVPDFKLEPKSWVTDDKSFAIEMVYSGTQETFQVCLQQVSASPLGCVALENLKTAR
jgi:steroid delta-isomerase-like uncharacterized protein